MRLHSKSVIVEDIPGFEREPDDTYADADLTAEQAGRLCYLSGHRPNPKTAINPDYLLNIENERHYSVLGHSAATIYIDEISRNCSHEIVRHRWFTFSEVSQRYVDVSSFNMVEHPGLEPAFMSSVNEQLVASWYAAMEAYESTVTYLVDGCEVPRKQARQAARSILPGGIETKILMSGNLRAWRDFLAQRLGPGADAEIRGVALEVLKIMKTEFPNSFQDFDSQGLITVERLIQRALNRHDAVDAVESSLPRSKNALLFMESVREILDKGIWILKEDSWEEDKI